MTGVPARLVDAFAMAAGSARLITGVSFLVTPAVAHRMWGGAPSARSSVGPLLRSMGYRDVLIGGLLLHAGLRGHPTAGWFLAFAGADATDLVGGLIQLDQLSEQQRRRGLGGAAAGFGVGVIGAIAAAGARRATT